MFFKSKPIITFTNLLQYPELSGPQLASKVIPNWYKETVNWYPETKEPNPKSLPTIKKCLPVFDAMTAGWIFNTPADVYVSQKDGEPYYETNLRNIIENHPVKQGHKHPSGNSFVFPKWINGWGVKTFKGYSCLFIPPMHNSNPWFECLPGVVDTDTYTSAINFPFVLKDPLMTGYIPAGTPMIQVIPFKREAWTFKKGGEKETAEAIDITTELNARFFNRYKNLYWSRKKWLSEE